MTTRPDAPPRRLRLVASGGQPKGFLELRRTFDELQRLFLELQHTFVEGVALAADGEDDRDLWLPILVRMTVMWAKIAGHPRREGAEMLARETFEALAAQHGPEPEPGARGRFLQSIDRVLSAVVDEVHAIHGPPS